MNLGTRDVLYRAIVVQLGGWESLTAQRDATEQERDRKKARIQRLWDWANQLDPDLRAMYHQVLSDMDRTWTQWEEGREFNARVATVRLPDLPPELRDVAS